MQQEPQSVKRKTSFQHDSSVVFLLNPRSFRYIFPAQKQKGENKVFWMQQEQHSVKKEQDLNMTHLCLFVKPKEFVRDSFPAHKQKGSRHT